MPEFVNPKYSDGARAAFSSPTRLECMMQDYAWLLPHGAKVGPNPNPNPNPNPSPNPNPNPNPHANPKQERQLVEGGSDALQLMNLLAFCTRTCALPKN